MAERNKGNQKVTDLDNNAIVIPSVKESSLIMNMEAIVPSKVPNPPGVIGSMLTK